MKQCVGIQNCVHVYFPPLWVLWNLHRYAVARGPSRAQPSPLQRHPRQVAAKRETLALLVTWYSTGAIRFGGAHMKTLNSVPVVNCRCGSEYSSSVGVAAIMYRTPPANPAKGAMCATA